MPRWLSDEQYEVLEAACGALIPADDDPGAVEAGVADYIDGLLGAFLSDPPRIWAGGPFSGRHGGDASFGTFLPLSAHEELAWRTRIEGSRGMPERERLGPVTGWQERYTAGLAALGADFPRVDPDEQRRRLEADPDFTALLYEHTCEGMYAAPEYGGNRDLIGWRYIGFEGDVQPRGYTDAEVAGP